MRPRKPCADRRALRIARCLVPLRRHLVQRKGFSAWGGSLLRRVRLPHPSGESFDLRKLRPNDSPPVAVTAGLRSSQGGLAACRHGPRSLRRIIRPAQAPAERFSSGRLAARPPRARLVPLRFACSSNLLSVLLRRPGEQITEARLSLRSNPFGGFSFFRSLRSHKSPGRGVPSSAPAESDLPCAGSGQIRFSLRSGLLFLLSPKRYGSPLSARPAAPFG